MAFDIDSIIIKSTNSRVVGLSMQMYRSPMAVWTLSAGYTWSVGAYCVPAGESNWPLIYCVSTIPTTISRHKVKSIPKPGKCPFPGIF